MGKTHFWRRPTELPSDRFAAAAKEIRRVVSLAGVPLAGFEGHGEPLFKDDAVVFNGVGSARCEPFQIRDTEFDRHGRPEVFSFCKTEGLPYDLAVKAADAACRETWLAELGSEQTPVDKVRKRVAEALGDTPGGQQPSSYEEG